MLMLNGCSSVELGEGCLDAWDTCILISMPSSVSIFVSCVVTLVGSEWSLCCIRLCCCQLMGIFGGGGGGGFWCAADYSLSAVDVFPFAWGQSIWFFEMGRYGTLIPSVSP
jgi:hypothetical protein